jgi:hypothetical protein
LAPAAVRAADLFLTGERESYLAVDKLNAMGRLPGFLANTRPYSAAAVRAALDTHAAPQGENTNDPGEEGLVNQIAGFDVTLTLPFPSQPVQAYLEMAGEDQAHLLGTFLPFPSKFGYLTGVFLPTLFGSAAHDLRVEWARNHWQGNDPAWYVHSVSGEGYAHFYRGRVLGHPMSTDAQNLSVQANHFLLPSTYLELTLSRTDRYSVGPGKETADCASACIVGWLSETIRAEGEVGLERVKNPSGLPGATAEDASFRVALSYRLGSGE